MADKRKLIQPESVQPERGLQSATEPELAAAEKSLELIRERGLKRRERRTATARPAFPVVKIISGGQTGADRAALDFALALSVPHGGWCPRGRLAEDGSLRDCYELSETPGVEYSQRTEWNVRDADGTVIFSLATGLSGGSKLTAQRARQLRRPCLHISRARDGNTAAARLRAFLRRHDIRVLNVAGPRASSEPGVARFVLETLEDLFGVPKSRAGRWNRYSR